MQRRLCRSSHRDSVRPSFRPPSLGLGERTHTQHSPSIHPSMCLACGWDTGGVWVSLHRRCLWVSFRQSSSLSRKPLSTSLGQATCTQDQWLLVPQGNERTRG